MTDIPLGTPSGDLLRGVPEGLPEELFETLTRSGRVRFERIVSNGQASPEGFWYEQDWDEFVAVLSGAAGLEIEGEGVRTLGPGAWILIKAGARHRVAWTVGDRPTVWLAVHVGEP